MKYFGRTDIFLMLSHSFQGQEMSAHLLKSILYLSRVLPYIMIFFSLPLYFKYLCFLSKLVSGSKSKQDIQEFDFSVRPDAFQFCTSLISPFILKGVFFFMLCFSLLFSFQLFELIIRLIYFCSLIFTEQGYAFSSVHRKHYVVFSLLFFGNSVISVCIPLSPKSCLVGGFYVSSLEGPFMFQFWQ